jgi:putative transposase
VKRKRHTPEEIIRKLRDAEAQLASGAKIADVTRKLGISENTFHRWRARYGGMGPSETKHLRELEKENLRLRKIVLNRQSTSAFCATFPGETSEPGPEASRCGARASGRLESPNIGLVGTCESAVRGQQACE